MYITLLNGTVINTPEINFNKDCIDWAVPSCEEAVQFSALYSAVRCITHEDPRLAPIDDHHAGYAEVLPF